MMLQAIETTLLNKIERSLNSIRPYLETDGGNVEVVELTPEMTLKVRLLGACESCPMSFTTMKAGIEETIKKEVPEILNVVAVK
jgi:Fe-S cluster biogenesis protein NfuA